MVQAPCLSPHTYLVQIKREGKQFEAGSEDAYLQATGEREAAMSTADVKPS